LCKISIPFTSNCKQNGAAQFSLSSLANFLSGRQVVTGRQYALQLLPVPWDGSAPAAPVSDQHSTLLMKSGETLPEFLSVWPCWLAGDIGLNCGTLQISYS